MTIQRNTGEWISANKYYFDVYPKLRKEDINKKIIQFWHDYCFDINDKYSGLQ